MGEKEKNCGFNERVVNDAENPLRELMRSSFFFRWNLRLLLFFAVVGGGAALLAGLMLRACSAA